MSKNQLAILPFGELTEDDIVTVRETIAKDCNDTQFRLFMGIAKASGANPILQEIHPSVFQGKLTVQFGIDFHVRKAKETEGYLGYDVQLVHENDSFKMHQEKAEDGRYFAVIDEHSWGFPRGKVIGGYALAYKEGFAPFTVVMDVEEVDHLRKSNIGMQKTMWTNYFNDMLKKHMVKRVLKAAYGLRFDDMEPTESVEPYEPPQRKDITAEVDAATSGSDPFKGAMEYGQKKFAGSSSENDGTDETEAINKAKADMVSKFKVLGISGKAKREEYINERVEFKGDMPTLAELQGLLKIMDLEIQQKQAADEDKLDDGNDDDLLELGGSLE